MNERTLELAVEANDQTGNKFDLNYKELDSFLEKFAELIVRECISIAQDRAAFDWAPPNDVNHIINEIKEHFGVEE